MGASRFVGRVGGLAVALGVGAAIFAGPAVAWADGPDASSPDAGPRAGGARTSASPARSANPQQRNSTRAGSASTVSSPAAGAVKTKAVARTAQADTSAPLDTPLAAALMAVARREPLAAASVAGPTASATSSAVTKDGLTVDPTVSFADGIFYGSLNATSSRGATLTYESLGGANGGKLALGTGPTDPTAQDFTALPYATWLDAATPSQTPSDTEQFQVRVSEVTGLDQLLINIPLVGLIAKPVIGLLQQLPLISTLLAPLIGASVVASVTVDSGAHSANPIAYTYDVTSFDGTKISTNFFPSVAVANGDVTSAQTVLNGPGLASPGQTNPYAEWGIGNQTLGVGTLRTADTAIPDDLNAQGYNVITWDPRGEFASGGVLQLDNPFFEGRDVSALIDFAAANTPSRCDGQVDCDGLPAAGRNPLVGMVGGSYGGGIQLTAASTDPRIDTVIPDIAWNSLNSSLYPDGVFKTAYGSLLLLSLITTGARINSLLYPSIVTGDLFSWLSQTAQAVLASSGPTALLNQLQAPALLTQGTVDVLFPLQQALDNAQTILANPYNTLDPNKVKMVWFCGGHGVCADPINPDQATLLKTNALDYLDKYLVDSGVGPSAADDIPTFQWFDQLGGYNFADKLPYQTGFNDLPDVAGTNSGGLLGILPLIGGSGPGPGTLPYSLGNGSPANNAINVDLSVPVGTQVVGAPHLSFTYQGLGTSGALFAQVIDKNTGRVLGNAVTPIAVDLDGRQHTVSMDLSDIAYSYAGQGDLELQITTNATAFANLFRIGVVNISDVNVTLPNRNASFNQVVVES